MFSPWSPHVLSLEFSYTELVNSMDNLLSYSRLVNARISTSEKDLPVNLRFITISLGWKLQSMLKSTKLLWASMCLDLGSIYCQLLVYLQKRRVISYLAVVLQVWNGPATLFRPLLCTHLRLTTVGWDYFCRNVPNFSNIKCIANPIFNM